MKKEMSYIIMLLYLLLLSCSNSSKKRVNSTSQDEIKMELSEGFHLLKSNCFACHSPDPEKENKIAPSLATIKKTYLGNKVSQDKFVKDLILFIYNPNEETFKMPEAIQMYNLMPKMSLNAEQITKIANYLYASEIEKPDWYTNQYPKDEALYSIAPTLSPIEQGQQIAMKTKAVLGKSLLSAIKNKGTEGALSFCSATAVSLTDSMALALNAKIKRVSDKNRNPNNAANAKELSYINTVQLAISQGKKPEPQLVSTEDKHVAYYPIMTSKMCMQCHGNPVEDVLPNTLERIEKLYPNDAAMAYSENQLRGIWVIEMDKE